MLDWLIQKEVVTWVKFQMGGISSVWAAKSLYLINGSWLLLFLYLHHDLVRITMMKHISLVRFCSPLLTIDYKQVYQYEGHLCIIILVTSGRREISFSTNLFSLHTYLLFTTSPSGQAWLQQEPLSPATWHCFSNTRTCWIHTSTKKKKKGNFLDALSIMDDWTLTMNHLGINQTLQSAIMLPEFDDLLSAYQLQVLDPWFNGHCTRYS